MRAIAIHEFGGPDVLTLVDLPRPEPGPGEVVVRVEAVAVARLDLFARSGGLPFVRVPQVLGGEHAGVVEAVGDGVDDLTPGARVAVFPVFACKTCRYCRAGREESCPDRELIGLQRPGAYAEYTCVGRENVTELPAGVAPVDAAAIAMSGPLAWRQFREAGVQPGDWVLVQAAGGALGSVTAALGVHRGARVIATARTEEHRAALRALGVELALDADDADFRGRVADATGGCGVDVAIDNIGDAELFATTLAVLGRTGVVVLSGAGQVAAADGRPEDVLARSPRVDLRAIYQLSQRIVGLSTADVGSFHALWADVAAGLRGPVDRTFPLAEARAAHARVGANEHFGRVVLTP